jgi:hypothetical protein
MQELVERVPGQGDRAWLMAVCGQAQDHAVHSGVEHTSLQIGRDIIRGTDEQHGADRRALLGVQRVEVDAGGAQVVGE